MNSKLILILASALALGGTGLASAATDAAAAPAAASAALTAGEVRKVDTEQGKVTIKHEAIANLEMPPMTMVFRASKPELLKDVKAGDKIRFRAENVAGGIVVTDIQAAN
ncbi:copper-binding protein [Ramlibacter sp.]|uniref:copper-binding protein n=1 Tax=Ramlibacter sp. TaxID=1917967 RepID=UPI0017AE9A6E|nr:copper-binding protein [Ramlibacter sp.]MBA2676146.1 copper-binding protein [Ramlibacter sp.]